jgi:hypothetical protein
MFRSRKVKTEYVSLVFSKDWSNAGAEIERLGKRLDAVRQARKGAKRNSWAKKHWTQTEQIILRKWKQGVRLRGIGLRQAGKFDSGPKIDYSWWEGTEEISMRFPVLDAISQLLTEKFGFASPNLDRAWEMAKEEKLQKARQGLA